MRRLILSSRQDGPRSEALMHLLTLNGLRITEALSRDVEDLDYDQGHRILRLERKGGKRAKAPLTPAAVRALEAYLAGRTTGPLFTTTTGRRLDRTSAYRIVRRLAQQADIPAAAHISPTASATASPPPHSTPAWPFATSKTPSATPTPAPPAATTAPATASTATPPTPWPRSSPKGPDCQRQQPVEGCPQQRSGSGPRWSARVVKKCTQRRGIPGRNGCTGWTRSTGH